MHIMNIYGFLFKHMYLLFELALLEKKSKKSFNNKIITQIVIYVYTLCPDGYHLFNSSKRSFDWHFISVEYFMYSFNRYQGCFQKYVFLWQEKTFYYEIHVFFNNVHITKMWYSYQLFKSILYTYKYINGCIISYR